MRQCRIRIVINLNSNRILRGQPGKAIFEACKIHTSIVLTSLFVVFPCGFADTSKQGCNVMILFYDQMTESLLDRVNQ